jgi:predicted dehydrogenase
MRIAIIGGLDRNRPLYQALAAAQGHTIFVHDGHMHGRASSSLEQLVAGSDVVVIVTEVNSHTAVQLARRALRRAGRTPVLLRKLGPSRFAALLDALAPAAAGAVPA